MFDQPGFGIRNKNGTQSGLIWGDLGHCHQIGAGIGGDCNGVPLNVVRYDSPVFGGFSVSASWGEDDMWDVAARYAGEYNGFKVAAAAAYSVNTDEHTVGEFGIATDTNIIAAFPGLLTLNTDSFGRRDTGYFQVGAYLEHVPTGLFLYGAYGREDVDDIYFTDAGLSVLDVGPFPLGTFATTGLLVPEDKPDHWYLKAGLRERWTPLGHTVLYGEYSQRNDMISPGAIIATATDSFVAGLPAGDGRFTTITGSEITMWGVGVVQEIDAAAMSVWLSFKHFEGEIDTQGCNVTSANTFTCTGATGTSDFDDFQLIKAGALINF